MTPEQFFAIFGLGFACGGIVVGRAIFWMDRVRYWGGRR